MAAQTNDEHTHGFYLSPAWYKWRKMRATLCDIIAYYLCHWQIQGFKWNLSTIGRFFVAFLPFAYADGNFHFLEVLGIGAFHLNRLERFPTTGIIFCNFCRIYPTRAVVQPVTRAPRNPTIPASQQWFVMYWGRTVSHHHLGPIAIRQIHVPIECWVREITAISQL